MVKYSALQKIMMRLVSGRMIPFGIRVFADQLLIIYMNSYNQFVADEILIKECVRLSFVTRRNVYELTNKYFNFEEYDANEKEHIKFDKLANNFFLNTLKRHSSHKLPILFGPSTITPVLTPTPVRALVPTPVRTPVPTPVRAHVPTPAVMSCLNTKIVSCEYNSCRRVFLVCAPS